MERTHSEHTTPESGAHARRRPYSALSTDRRPQPSTGAASSAGARPHPHTDRKPQGATGAGTHHRSASSTGTGPRRPSGMGGRSSGGSRGGRMRPPKHTLQNHIVSSAPRRSNVIPPPAEGVLRVIPLGGVQEIGKNMTAIEYGDEIIVIDAGFQFSEVETPGIDYILPDTTYLKERKDKIKALFITHGHFDHIGAIPYIMNDIGNPPIYSRQFGALLIQKRQAEFPDTPPLNIRVVRGDERIQIGQNFVVGSFSISHAIPDSMGLLIDTPQGTIAFIEDVRVDHIDGVATSEELAHYKDLKDKKVLLFTLDSTSIEKPGFSTPESKAVATIENIMKDVPGRLIIGTFASQVERVIQIINAADRYNKKVVIDGRSMKTNIEIVKELKLLKHDNIIPIEEMGDYPPGKIVVMATGAQGEEYSVFDRIANKSHKYITLTKSDTVLFSSSVIPGNETAITRLMDNLYRQDAKVITYMDSPVHASGHGSRGELEWIHKQISYKYFMPVHGFHYKLRMHAELAEGLGVAKENIVIPDNGSIIEFSDNGDTMTVRKEKASNERIMVDGFSIGGQQEVVVRDRQTLAEEGIFMIVVSVNPKTGKLRKSPDIISRGFVYLKEQQELINGARSLVAKTVEQTTKGMNPINFDIVKNVVTDDVRRYLFQKTAKSPIVIPVVIGV